MKISFLIQDITTHGGTEHVVCDLANSFAKHGHQVTIVSLFRVQDNPQYPLQEDVGIKYVSSIPYSLQMTLWQRLKAVVHIIKPTRHVDSLIHADIIICEKTLAAVVAWQAGFAARSIVCQHSRYEVYGGVGNKIRDWVYNKFACLVVLAAEDQQRFEDAVHTVEVIPNMASMPIQPYAGTDCRRIISVGRLAYEKGYDILLKAVALSKDCLHNWVIDIYGDGDEREALMQQRAALEIEDIVHFRGSTTQVQAEYTSSGIYILSSRLEGLPLVMLEAASAQLPIIATACSPGVCELLKNDRGILCDINEHALAEAIRKLTADADLRTQLSRQSIEILKPYTPDNIYNKWITLITTIHTSCKTT